MSRGLTALFLAAAMTAICVPLASAQEAWCIAHPSNCVGSETFQSTSYRQVGGAGSRQHGVFLGDETGSKPMHWGDVVPVGTPASVSWTYGPGDTFGSMLQIETDPSVLSLLPNRNTASVARFVRSLDSHGGAIRFGEAAMDLAARGAKRLALRWYSYHVPGYQWAGDGGCTNGKIAHNSNGYQQPAMMTLTIHGGGSGGATSVYTFLNTWKWLWGGRTLFEGFTQGAGPRSGAGVSAYKYRGKWFRHEVVVSNPRASDVGGYDFQYFVKDVTDGGKEVEDIRLSAGCTSCMPQGGPNFSWTSDIRPSNDMGWLHTEFYRAGICRGWQGWLYAVVATWTTNAGQRIGAAAEVEGETSGR
jgi:hypothetical protein